MSQQVLGTNLSPAHAAHPGIGSPAHPAYIADYTANLAQEEGGGNYHLHVLAYDTIVP